MKKLIGDARGVFGGMEWIIIMIMAFVLLFGGAKKIPEIARGLGRALGEFQRGRMEAEREIRREFERIREQAKLEIPPGEREPQRESQRESQLTQEELQVIQAAKSLGIQVEGKTIQQLKQEITRKLSGE